MEEYFAPHGVGVDELMPLSGVWRYRRTGFVPVKGNNVTAITYSRPTTPVTAPAQTSGVKVVKAQSGDTVSKLAARYGANATEVAKFNGLLVNSVLGAGREIRIPGK